ncbi:MAG: hypothetical protein EAZ96_26335 [Oscillatoriales cyanobacterium]|nr:MAG: hypothetical protein EAZ96_26335 [Oscillatoriales cyanobacterium]
MKIDLAAESAIALSLLRVRSLFFESGLTRPKKPGFLPNFRAETKFFRKKTRFLGPHLSPN